jgi:hypothetical protein
MDSKEFAYDMLNLFVDLSKTKGYIWMKAEADNFVINWNQGDAAVFI